MDSIVKPPREIEDSENWLVREECMTDEKYGFYPDKRPIDMHIKNGFIVLDKPKGPTSHQVSAWVRDLFGAKKAGHTGTLDPQVTGVLPTFIENSVKAMPVLVRSDKEYVCLMQLHNDVPEEKIRSAMHEFVGTVTQMPPVKSGVKREFRQRKIHYLNILEIDGRDVLFVAGTEAGTYIRTLCVDVGKKLRTGAHMQELRRTRAGKFTEKEAHGLQEVRDAYEFFKEDKDETLLRKIVLPLEASLKNVGQIVIKDSAVSAVCNGAPLHAGGVCRITKNINSGDTICLMSLKGELVALGVAKADSRAILEKKDGAIASVSRVALDPKTYPKMWGQKEE